ncbi:MFS general substrate transporter [Mycena olivaceomarginata]|nr:MFS general substrate transporter [Mycena olivaceomarginata]
MSTSELDEKSGSDHGLEVAPNSPTPAPNCCMARTMLWTRAEAERIKKKIDLHLLPLMCSRIQFMDKATLGNAAILGIIKSAKLTTNELGTVFYLSYLAFEFPQNLALQRFPVAKWISINIFVWAVALMAHAACKDFAGLMVVRVVLGMCEGCVTAGFLLTLRVCVRPCLPAPRCAFLMNGTAQIISGFVSFGCLHIHTKTFQPWQWLMIITGLITLVTAAAFWFFFPDSPTTAWFLTPEERVSAVLRIKNKHFKKEQMWEALTDPKTWIFALFAATNVTNGLVNQRQLIVSSFGFTPLQTTLLGCVDGVVEIVAVGSGVIIAARLPNSRAWVGIAYILPSILAVFLTELLPWSNKIGLLFGIWLTGTAVTSFVILLSWLSNVTAGHTKRITSNTILLCAYCAGNSVAPQMWLAKYKPRNHVPWIVIACCYGFMIVLLVALRTYLVAENKRRDAEGVDDTYDNVYIQRATEDGGSEKVKIDKEYLDLTDIQNRAFRYVF